MTTSAMSETREENTPEKRLLDVALHTFKLQSYNITARTSMTKPQTALTNPKLAAEALVVVGVVTGGFARRCARPTELQGSDIGFDGTDHISLDHRFQFPRTSTTKPQTALTNPKLAAEALVVSGVVTGAISASLAPSTAVSNNDSNFCQHYCMSHVIANLSTPTRHCTTHTHTHTPRCNRNKWCLCGPSKCISRKSHVFSTFFYGFLLEFNFRTKFLYPCLLVSVAYPSDGYRKIPEYRKTVKYRYRSQEKKIPILPNRSHKISVFFSFLGPFFFLFKRIRVR
jgi:hypothetical protein